MTDLPYISVLTPCYNRPMFLASMIENINCQNYPKDKLEWCLLDDGKIPLSDSPLFSELEKLVAPVKVVYKYEKQKRILGDKRNKLVKTAKHKILINMDDDDIYFPTYISHSIDMMKQNNTLVGSNRMLIMFPSTETEKESLIMITTSSKRQIHENTMCFTRKHFNSTSGFVKAQTSEGTGLIDNVSESVIGLTDITLSIICMQHKNNTFDKRVIFKDAPVIDHSTIHPTIQRRIKDSLAIIESV